MLKSYRTRSIALAVGLAGAAAILVGLYIKHYRNDVNSGVDLVSVLVATRDIPEGTEGTRLATGKYLKREQVLRRSVVPGAIVETRAIAALVTGQKIFGGEQVTVRQFRPLAQQGVLAKISGNERGLVVAGDENQLLYGAVHEGDHVDVLANIKYTVRPTRSNSSDERRRVATRVILRNLLVLRAPAEPKSGVGSGGTTSIMLALTDSQAQKLFFATKNGDWSLALRPVAKPADSPESVETIEAILGDGLKFPQLYQLTGGFGRESINGQ
jgi:Flp pilus assembly protein CpaB